LRKGRERRKDAKEKVAGEGQAPLFFTGKKGSLLFHAETKEEPLRRKRGRRRFYLVRVHLSHFRRKHSVKREKREEGGEDLSVRG